MVARPSFVVAVVLAALSLGSSTACSSNHTLDGALGDAGDSRVRPAPLGESGPCEEDSVRGCSVTLGKQGNILNCFHGTQSCVGGSWLACGDGTTMTERVREPESAPGVEAQALSQPTKCTNNPCNPFCQGFTETPMTPVVAMPGPGGSFDWNTGSLSSFPGGLVKKGLEQPCDEGLDCQFNMRCDNPTYGSCQHSVCQSGVALDSSCSDCAARICAADSSCCSPPASTPGNCAHDPCVTGARLKDDCDPCVAKICATMPSCCATGPAGGWTQACADAVVSSCGASCSCQTSEKTYGGHCYYYEESNAKWTSAETACQGRGTNWHLVTIDNAAENTFIGGWGDDSKRWLGFTDQNSYSTESNWVWASATGGTWKDTTKLGTSYTNFKSGEPATSSSSPDCARMRNADSGKWEGGDCSNTQDYICEGPGTKMVAAPSTATWGASCVAKVQTVCDAKCHAVDPTVATGVCTPWYPGQKDPTCPGIDLALGVPCDHVIPVCNHGNTTAPAGITVATFPANSAHYPQCTADIAEASAVTCVTDKVIPPGQCISLSDAGCKDKNGATKLLNGNREIIVNPLGSVAECGCQDNWTLYSSGATCGPPSCAGGNTAATSVKKPVDIIIAIDNSGSMAGEISAVQARIDADLASILGSSGIDYRVIMVSRFGDVDTSVGDSDHPICISAPLGANACTDAAHETLVHNPPHFFHYSANIGSLDSWCQLLYGFNRADEINEERTGWVDIAPSGWGAFLRPSAFKAFLVITDDDMSCTDYGYNFKDSNTVAGGTAAAAAFDTALLALSPTQFGTAAKRNYVWHSIIGMVENPSGATVPWGPSAAIQTSKCSPTDQSEGPGTGYQALSKMTGGLRYPICQNANFNAVFQAIAQDIVDTASAGCEFALPADGSFSTIGAKVSYTNAADVRTGLTQVAGAAACATNTWYFNDPISPTLLTLCPTTCSAVQADIGAQVWAELGCPSTLATSKYAQTYSAACPKGSFPQWGFLSYSATVPTGTSVQFQARVASTEAGLASAVWTLLATATPAAPNCPESGPSPCPVSLYSIFGAEAVLPSIEVEMTVNPSGSSSPSVSDWRVTYSCPDAE